MRPRGYTLVEVLAALALTAIGLVAAGLLLVQAVRLEAEAAALTRAVRLARDLAEELRALPRPDGAPPRALAATELADCAPAEPACRVDGAIVAACAAWRARLAPALGPESAATLAAGADGSVAATLRRHAGSEPLTVVLGP